MAAEVLIRARCSSQEFEGMPILRRHHDGELKHVMSNSFGFGGTNGTLILSKV